MKNIIYTYDEKSATFQPKEESKKHNWMAYIFGILFLFSLVFIGFTVDDSASTGKNDIIEMKTQYEELSEKLNQTQKILKTIEKKDNQIYRTYFNMDSISEDERQAGFGGINLYEKLSKLSFGNLVAGTTKKLDALSKQLFVQEKSLNEILKVAINKDDYFVSIPAIMPIANSELKRVASGFGRRIHPILKIGKLHEGLDFSAEIGTPIYATANGKVEKAGLEGGYGNVTLLNHENGFKTLYGHQSKIIVSVGQSVKRGQVIGYVGNTGLSSGPHLHYEVHKSGVKVDPISYFYQDLSAEEYNILVKNTKELSVSFD